jgi:hypothetical protein
MFLSLLRRRAATTLAAAVALLAVTASARAQTQTFDLSYSGAAFGNTAVGTGTITLDLSLLNNPGDTSTFFDAPFVTAFSLTITGASSGNGTFGLADFNDIILFTNGATLDFSQELVGQPIPDGLPFGTVPSFGEAGDFNIFPNFSNPAAPVGTFYFAIATDGGLGDQLNLTSFRPSAAIPEPGTFALLGAGLLPMAGAVTRRRRGA